MRGLLSVAVPLVGLCRSALGANVFAHVVQGDFQNYAQQDWADDFALAKAASIDAFAINVGCDSTDAAELTKMFAAAESAAFSLFYSFDMVYFSNSACSSQIVGTYMTHVTSSAYFMYNGDAFVSTFGGDTSGMFLGGASDLASSNAGWASLWDQVKSQYDKSVYFVPDFNDAANIGQDTFQGVMSWDAWGDSGRTVALTLDNSQANTYANDAKSQGLTFMAPVSAFFFVADAASNNYIYRSDDFLLPNHYSDLITMANKPAFIELLSWNDFGESHYLGPIRANAGVPSGAGGYATFDHTPMLSLSAYYSQWYKTGTKPNIAQNSIVWWYRPHPKDAVATAPSQAKPTYSETTDDKIYAAVLLPSSSTAANVIITTNGAKTTVAVHAGQVNLVSAPFTAGDVSIELVTSSGASLLSQTGAAISGSPAIYNFNYHAYVVPSTAAPGNMYGVAPASNVAVAGDVKSAVSSSVSSAHSTTVAQSSATTHSAAETASASTLASKVVPPLSPVESSESAHSSVTAVHSSSSTRASIDLSQSTTASSVASHSSGFISSTKPTSALASSTASVAACNASSSASASSTTGHRKHGYHRSGHWSRNGFWE